MDIKITLDISDRFDSALARIVSAVQMAPAPIASPAECDCLPEAYAELETLVSAKNSPVETPESSAGSKPVEPPKSEPDAKIEVPAAANAETPSPEVMDEAPVEPPKPKRSHHKKAEKPAEPAPQPDPQLESQPDPRPESQSEPEPDLQPEPESEPEMTLDEIRSVCVKAAKVGKTKIITDYLAAHSAELLSKLDPKFYAELSKIVEAAL